MGSRHIIDHPPSSAPARSRTRNFSFEARGDVQFHHQGKHRVVSGPSGSRTPISWLKARWPALGPTAHQVAEVGVEPTIPGSRPGRYTRVCVLGHQVAEAGFEPASGGL